MQEPHSATAILQLAFKGEDASELQMRVRNDTPFGTMLSAWCTKKGFDPNTVRMLYDSERLNACQTPLNYDMEDGDIVDVVLQRCD